MLISLTDITAQRTASERLAFEATHDSLTGLPSRAHVVTRITEALESGGHHVLAAVLFIDLGRCSRGREAVHLAVAGGGHHPPIGAH